MTKSADFMSHITDCSYAVYCREGAEFGDGKWTWPVNNPA